MSNEYSEEPGGFGFDMASVHEFVKSNVEGFENHMLYSLFNAEADDPFMNMLWDRRPNRREEIENLKKFRTGLEKLVLKFDGALGIYNENIFLTVLELDFLIESSFFSYNYFFGHETRGNPDWAARNIACICFLAVSKCGRTPTLGTRAENDRPTGEYCKLVEGALRAAGLKSHWNSPAIWAYKKYTSPKK